MQTTSRDEKFLANSVVLIYVIVISLLSIFFFLCGFFPIKNYDDNVATMNDVPEFIGDIRVKRDVLYKPVVKKLIIMVIDALRWDFIVGPRGKNAMPKTNGFLEDSSTCLLKAKVQPPTVTMPRIKATTTGSVPSFVDVIFNLGGKSVVGDSILLQAKAHGHKLIFYGDDTWLQLFPDMFERHDGTTSFFVTDFTEVDNNVTRHIPQELRKNDWSIMILHYLGVDHIGHLSGPFSPLIEPKFKEMDDIIQEIYAKVSHWNQYGDPSIFIVCGDHGMKNSGGHGGSTEEETTVPIITFGAKCSKTLSKPAEIAQIDIAPTLSVLLGVPIPLSNFGSVSLSILDSLSISRKLFVMYYNAKQVFSHFQKLPDYELHSAHGRYLNTVDLHVDWLKSNNQSESMAMNIIQYYQTALTEMKTLLIDNSIKYDTCLMIAAIIFLFHILCITATQRIQGNVAIRNTILLISMNIILWLILAYIFDAESTSTLNVSSIGGISLIFLLLLILSINCYLLQSIDYSKILETALKKYEISQWIILLAVGTHTVSFGSSSFIEEEHQTWYFFWPTFLMAILYHNIKKNYQSHTQASLKLIFLLALHRVLRKLNSTGDKYAHLPDIARFLKDGDQRIAITFLVLTSFFLLIWIDVNRKDKTDKAQSLIFDITLATCIYLRHMANNYVVRVPFYPPSRGIFEAKIFWYVVALYFLRRSYQLVVATKYDNRNYFSELLNTTLYILVASSAILHEPYNLILLPMQLVVHLIITAISCNCNNKEVIVYGNICVGKVFYFYQGNSNSLATINVASGYVGLETYKPFITGVFLTINTYSAIILAYSMLIRYAISDKRHHARKTLIEINSIYMRWSLLPMMVYTVIICIQRHHLFVWSVFSPKLLYEAMHSAVICCVVLVTMITVMLQDIQVSWSESEYLPITN